MKNGIIYCAYNKINGKRYIGKTIQRLCERKGGHYSKQDCPYFHHALMKYDREDWDWQIIEENLPPEELKEREKYWIAYYDLNNPEKGYNISPGGDGGEQTQEQQRYARDAFVKKYGVKYASNAKYRNIRCVETDEIFKSAAEAGRATGITYSHITEAANGKLNTAGGYHWEWCFDISFFPNAIYCKELDKIYLTYNQAHTEDNFSGVYLGRAFKEQGSPCVYAGYTFYKINE